jgi:glycolate oxidase iron-sulfur subunit
MPTLSHLHDEASKCVKCGRCLSVCPIFREVRRETAVARGKLALAEAVAQGEVTFSKKTAELLNQCLLCGACAEECENEVDTPAVVLTARSTLATARGLSLGKRAALKLLLLSPFSGLFLKSGSLMQRALFRKIPAESGLRTRLRLPYIDKDRFLPRLSEVSFLEQVPTWTPAIRGGKSAAFFTGCFVNYMYPKIGHATVNVITRHGVSLFVPKDQQCCGLIALASGDGETAKKLLLRNLRVFDERAVDYVVTSCASCGYQLKKHLSDLLKGESEETRRKAAQFSAKVMDVTEFLVKVLKVPERYRATLQGANTSPVKVTYHDPCHLRRKQGVFTEPRLLLQRLPSCDLVEMGEPSQCCGSGGSFSVSYYDISKQIIKRKIEDIEATGAHIVATGCSGCLLQLKDGAHKAGLKAEVMHTVELVERYGEVGNEPPCASVSSGTGSGS